MRREDRTIEATRERHLARGRFLAFELGPWAEEQLGADRLPTVKAIHDFIDNFTLSPAEIQMAEELIRIVEKLFHLEIARHGALPN